MNVNWKFYSEYSESHVLKYAPKRPGVYLLWVKLTDDKWRCFYVGKAEDLESRLLDHLSKSEPNECLKKKVSSKICGFEYAEVSKESDRKGIEKYLCDQYKPECNQNDPGGTPIVVNLH